MTYLKTADGGIVNLDQVLAIHVVPDDRPEAQQLALPDGFAPHLLATFSAAGKPTIVAAGLQAGMAAALEWLTNSLGRRRLIDIGEFLGSKEFKAANGQTQLVRPIVPPPNGEKGR